MAKVVSSFCDLHFMLSIFGECVSRLLVEVLWFGVKCQYVETGSSPRVCLCCVE